MRNWYTHLTRFQKRSNNNAGTGNAQYIGQSDAVFVEAQKSPKEEESHQPSVEGVTRASSNQSSEPVVLTKKGNLSLIAQECSKYAKIAIRDNTGEDIEFYQVLKNGHSYRELISQGVWESKLDNYQSLTKK